MPYDKNFTETYDPIDTRKIWCGNSNETPDGYNSVGNLPQCLQKELGPENVLDQKKGNLILF